MAPNDCGIVWEKCIKYTDFAFFYTSLDYLILVNVTIVAALEIFKRWNKLTEILKMGILSFSEIISDQERLAYLLVITAIIVRLFIWFLDERSGNNYYKKHPTARAMDELAKEGVNYSVDDLNKAISSIDLQDSKEEQAKNLKNKLKSKAE